MYIRAFKCASIYHTCIRALQCAVALYCSVLQCVAECFSIYHICVCVLQSIVAVCCSMLQRVAVEDVWRDAKKF